MKRKKLEERPAISGVISPANFFRCDAEKTNENYFSHLNDEFVDQLLTCVAKAWDELTSMCVMCPTRCISEMNARASMFDDPEYYT